MRKLFKFIAPLALMPSMVAPMIVTSCGGKMYHYDGRIDDYLHEITYDDYREDTKWETIKEAEAFGCSSVRCGNYYGRNFDYVYNDTPEFIVHVKANEKKHRHESLAVATHFGLRENKLVDGQYNKQLELIPNLTMDGVNDAGVICSANVVSMEPNREPGVEIPETHPDNKNAKKLHALFIVRYVLDNASSAENAVSLLKNDNLNIVGNLKNEMNLHVMIADKKDTYVVEFFRQKGSSHNHFDVVAEKKDDINAIMTNHYLNMDKASDAFINDEKFGNERLEILKNGYPKSQAEKDAFNMNKMVELMQSVKFSIAYGGFSSGEVIHTPIPYGFISSEGELGDLTSEWYSEKVNQSYLKTHDVGHTKDWWAGFAMGKFGELKKAYWDAIEHEKRAEANPAFWQTTHNSTYEWDWNNNIVKLRVFVQEKYEAQFARDFELKLKNTL